MLPMLTASADADLREVLPTIDLAAPDAFNAEVRRFLGVVS
jgi:hypothetical protein